MQRAGFSEEDARKLARHIVEQWESIEERAARFQTAFGTSDELRIEYAAAMRRMLGGEEAYRAAKQALQEQG